MEMPMQHVGRRPGIAQGITLVTAMFLPVLAIISMFPAVPAMIEHFADDPNARWKVPSMVTAPGLTVAIVALFVGMLVDRFGRRSLLLISTFFYGFFGAVPVLLESLDAIYVSRLFLGLSEAAILTTLNTLIGDYWDERGRRNWLTIQGMAGPAMASVLLYFAGSLVAWRWNAIFFVYLVAFPIFVAMCLWMYEPARNDSIRSALGLRQGDSVKSPVPWRTMTQIGALTVFCSLLYYVFIINGGLIWQELGVKDAARIGRITAFPSLFILAGAAVFWTLGRLGAGSRGQMFAFLGLLNLGLVVIGLSESIAMTIVGMAIQQTGAGMAIPSLVAWSTAKLPFEHRGRGMGVWTACFFFGQFASPLIVSAAQALMASMHATFTAAGIIGLVGAFVILVIMKGPKANIAAGSGAVEAVTPAGSHR